ncbi:MAG TPA: cupin domain-containing protein [Burkholderiales bacterium]|nr:cupin domain-containing protein [Burkholderiales bacterium]
MRAWATLAVVLSILFGSAAAMAAGSDAETLSVVDADKLEWKDYPGLPGVKFVVLAGNPKEAGLYVIRVKFAPHTMSRPHWHPEARYVVVLKGTWWAGTGDTFDPEKTTPLPTGGFAMHTAGHVHYDGAKDEEVIVQITGIGPSGTNVVATKEH